MDFITTFFIILGMVIVVIAVAAAFSFSVEAIDRRLGFPWGGVIMLSVYAIVLAAVFAAILTAPHSDTAPATDHSAEPAGTPSGPSECP